MEEEEKFWMQFRQGLLVIVAAIEARCRILPSTSELRRKWREDLPKPEPAARGKES